MATVHHQPRNVIGFRALHALARLATVVFLDVNGHLIGLDDDTAS